MRGGGHILLGRIGYAIFGLGLAAGLVASFWRPVGEASANTAFIALGVVMFVGIILVVVAGAIRLAKSEVRLRPLMAVKTALIIFAITLAFRLVVWAVFPSTTSDWTGAAITAAIFAVGFSLYTTAYRRVA